MSHDNLHHASLHVVEVVAVKDPITRVIRNEVKGTSPHGVDECRVLIRSAASAYLKGVAV